MLTAKGAIDMTATAPGYNPDQLHYWRAFQTPLVFTTSKQAMSVLGTVVKEFPVYRQEMDRAVAVGDDPVASHELDPAVALVCDRHLVGEREAVLVGRRAVFEIRRRDGDPDAFSDLRRHGPRCPRDKRARSQGETGSAVAHVCMRTSGGAAAKTAASCTASARSRSRTSAAGATVIARST